VEVSEAQNLSFFSQTLMNYKGASPFVIAAIEGGVKFLPDVFNALLLFFTLSAANAGKPSRLFRQLDVHTKSYLKISTPPPVLSTECHQMAKPQNSSARRLETSSAKDG
jgi:hypothetical protein